MALNFNEEEEESEEESEVEVARADELAMNAIGSFLFILAMILVFLGLFKVYMRGDDIRPSVLGVDESGCAAHLSPSTPS